MDDSDTEPSAKKRRIESQEDSQSQSASHSFNQASGENKGGKHISKEKEPSFTPKEIVSILEKVADGVNSILQKAKSLIAESIETFGNTHCGKTLYPIFQVYKSTFKENGINSKAHLEKLCGANFRHAIVRDGFEYLQEVEDDWGETLTEVDRKLDLNRLKQSLQVGDDIPDGLEIYNDEISEAGGRVVVVSLADPEGAQTWLSEMNCSFGFILDRPRKLYKALGLGRSISQVWGIPTIDWYCEQHIAGRPTYRPSKEDDVYQLGGDLLMGKDGRILLVHRGSNPIDRPEISTLLSLMKSDQDSDEQ